MHALELSGDYAKPDSSYELNSEDEDTREDKEEDICKDEHEDKEDKDDGNVNAVGGGKEQVKLASVQDEVDEVEDYGYRYCDRKSGDSNNSDSEGYGSDIAYSDSDSG